MRCSDTEIAAERGTEAISSIDWSQVRWKDFHGEAPRHGALNGLKTSTIGTPH